MNRNIFHIDIWRVLRLGLITALALGYILQWMQMISNTTSRTGTDFIHFYAAGQIITRYGFSSVYNLALQQKIEEEAVGFSLAEGQILPYNHMPYILPLMKILIDSDYVGSFVRWVVIALIIYLAGNVFLIHSLFQMDRTWSAEIFTLLGALITFYPFFISLLLGQDTALLYLGAAFLCVGIMKKEDWLAGIGLALTTIRPQIALMLAFPFLFRERRIWWRFIIAASFLVAASVLMLGADGIIDFVNVLIITARGDWYGTHQDSMLNFLGLMLRVLPFVPDSIIRLIAWIGYVLGIILMSLLWLRSEEFNERLLGISILAALFLAPHLHYHDLTLLVLPTLLLLKNIKSKCAFLKSVTLMVGASFLLFISSALPLLYFSLPYILAATLAWFFYRNQQSLAIKT